jgi:hypothetical protein
MALQNRVDPWGELVASPAKGLLMGNRGGRFHLPGQKLGRRRWVSSRWITCLLAFRDRPPRHVWGQSYTELFFLDEVTALAAGHRPCFECRRADAKAFLGQRCLADMDRQLHQERRAEKPVVTLDTVPDGAMVEWDGEAFACRRGKLLRWSFDGYCDAVHIASGLQVKLLTPPTIAAILASGYQPRWHDTAQQWDD